MSNHHRGLWGYHGHTASGHEITVQATGIGGPSAVVVLGELAELGVRRAIRVGTCTAADGEPPAGAGLLVERAIAADGASVALGARRGEALTPSEHLRAALAADGTLDAGVVVSRDVHERGPAPEGAAAEASGASLVGDLQTAATFAACRRVGIEVAAVLAVASSGGRRLEDEPLEAVLLRLATVAAGVLADHQTL